MTDKQQDCIRILERIIKTGCHVNTFKIRIRLERLPGLHLCAFILKQMHDFHGWSAGALWEDLKFDVHYFRDIERLAMVGEKKWQKGMSKFCKPFTTATIRYFDRSQEDEARTWVKEK